MPSWFNLRKWIKVARILVNIAHEFKDLWDAIFDGSDEEEIDPPNPEPPIEEPIDDELEAKFRKLENN